MYFGTLSFLTGLKVRMGIATGVLTGAGAISSGSAVHEAAKRETLSEELHIFTRLVTLIPGCILCAVISDAGAGGQVLMCESTFKLVEHLAEEFGCVGVAGTSYSNLYSVKGQLAKLIGG